MTISPHPSRSKKTHVVIVDKALYLSYDFPDFSLRAREKRQVRAFLTMMVRKSGSDDDEELPYLKWSLDTWYETVREMDGTRDWWQGISQTRGIPAGADLNLYQRNIGLRRKGRRGCTSAQAEPTGGKRGLKSSSRAQRTFELEQSLVHY